MHPDSDEAVSRGRHLQLSLCIGWVGATCAALGALLLASRTDLSSWGWVLFLASSSLLFGWSLVERHKHQLMMQGVFLEL